MIAPPGNGNPADYPTPAGYPPGVGQVVIAWDWLVEFFNQAVPGAISELYNLSQI